MEGGRIASEEEYFMITVGFTEGGWRLRLTEGIKIYKA